MWNEGNWTLISMPVTSTRAQWDEGLRTVRQFNDLLRVLPPMPTASTGQPVARRSGSPSRPITPAPAGRELPPGYAGQPRPDPLRRPAPPVQQPAQHNGRQSPNYQR